MRNASRAVKPQSITSCTTTATRQPRWCGKKHVLPKGTNGLHDADHRLVGRQGSQRKGRQAVTECSTRVPRNLCMTAVTWPRVHGETPPPLESRSLGEREGSRPRWPSAHRSMTAKGRSGTRRASRRRPHCMRGRRWARRGSAGPSFDSCATRCAAVRRRAKAACRSASSAADSTTG